MGLPSSTDKPINSSSSAETPIFGSSPRSPSLKSADSTNSPENLSRINQATTGGSKTNAGNSVFYTTRSAISPSGHDAKTDEATEKFLSSMASQVKRVLSSIKQGFVDAAVSIFRCFSSLFKRESKDVSQEILKPPVSPTQVQLQKLSSVKKQDFMDAAVKFFQGDRIKQEGVFRVNGSAERVKELSTALTKKQEGEEEAVSVDLGNEETKNVASLFKEFVLSCELFSDADAFEALTVVSSLDKDKQVDALKAAIGKLSPEKQQLLKGLLSICGEVESQQSVTLMKKENLAICFAPNLLPLNLSVVQQLTKLGPTTKAVEFMIEHRAALFPDEKV